MQETIPEQQHLFRHQEGNHNNNNNKNSRIQKAAVGIVFGTLLVFVLVDSFTTHYLQHIQQISLQWMTSHPVGGVVAFVALYGIATVLFVPGSILTLGFGFICANSYGLQLGMVVATVAVCIGASLGAMAAFLLGRYLLRPLVLRRSVQYPLLQAVDKALVTKQGFRVMVLLRLSPIVPFNALNYMSGATSISFAAYSCALVSIVPGTTFYVFLGATAGSFAESIGTSSDSASSSTIKVVSIVVGVLFGACAIFLISCHAKKELNDICAKQQAEQERNEEPVLA